MNNVYVTKKVILKKYYKCLLISFIVGSLLLIFADKSLFFDMSNGIKVHFEIPFRSAGNIVAAAVEVLEYSLTDIVLLLVVFAFAAIFLTCSFVPHTLF